MVSEPSLAMRQILAIHARLIAERKHQRDSRCIERFNRLISNIKGVGLLDRATINGTEGRYLIIEGNSWVRASQGLELTAAPSFVLWEESAFFSFLETDLVGATATAVKKPRAAVGADRPLSREEA